MRAWSSETAVATPPGLDSRGEDNAADDETAQHYEDIAQEVRQAVMSVLDTKLTESLEGVFQHGEQGAQQFMLETQSCQEEMSKQVVEMKKQQEGLERESKQLQQQLTGMLAQLVQWGETAGKNGGYPDIASWRLGSPCSTSASACMSPNSLTPAPTLSEQSNSEGQVWDYTSNQSGFPDVPAFPFPQTSAAPPVALSLADALGLDDGVGPAQPIRAPPAVPAFPLFAPTPALSQFLPAYGLEALAPPIGGIEEPADDETDGFVFSVTLRKAAGASLGLFTTAIGQASSALRIDGFHAGGAVEAWNRQCWSSGAAAKVLLPGDTIVSVNEAGDDAAAMTLECEKNNLVRLMVVRSCSLPAAPMPVASMPVMRAEASAFVPSTAAPGLDVAAVTTCTDQCDKPGSVTI